VPGREKEKVKIYNCIRSFIVCCVGKLDVCHNLQKMWLYLRKITWIRGKRDGTFTLRWSSELY